VQIQYKLELHAQGYTETATLDSIDVSRKMYLLKELASLWGPDFHVNTVFEEAVAVTPAHDHMILGTRSMKYGFWWMWREGNLIIRDCNTNTKLSRTWPRDAWPVEHQSLRSVIVDTLQNLVVLVYLYDSINVDDAEQDHNILLVEFRLASSQHLDAMCTPLMCTHTFSVPGLYGVSVVGQPAICGDRIVVLYYTITQRTPSNMSIQVMDWRKGHAKSVSLLYS